MTSEQFNIIIDFINGDIQLNENVKEALKQFVKEVNCLEEKVIKLEKVLNVLNDYWIKLKG